MAHTFDEWIFAVNNDFKITYTNDTFRYFYKTNIQNVGDDKSFDSETIFQFFNLNFDDFLKIFSEGEIICSVDEIRLTDSIIHVIINKFPVYKDHKIAFVVTSIKNVSRYSSIAQQVIDSSISENQKYFEKGTYYDENYYKSKIGENLLEDEIKFRILVENIREGVVLIQNHTILFANKSFCKIAGIQHCDIMGKNINEFISPENIDDALVYYQINNDKINDVSPYEFQMMHHESGKFIEIEFYADTFDYHGKPALLASINDISERKKINHELLVAKEKAEESDRLKTAFLANLSHEIRTPMNAIVGFAQLLDEENLPNDIRKKYLEYIFNSSNKLLSIINDILNISTLVSGQLKLKVRPVSINQIIDTVYQQLMSENIKPDNVVLLIDKQLNNVQSVILCDELRLISAIKNIGHNALKFTNTGHVKIGYRLQPDDTILFYVEDTGIGIASENQHKVFQPFVQVDGSLTRKFGGTGIGLSIAQGIVELFGGKIWFDSTPDVGSVFYFSIPYLTDVEQRENIFTKMSQTKNINQKVVLIVEDDMASAEYLMEVVMACSAQAINVVNGREAVKLMERTKVDLIFMDVQMPTLNGYEATREIKKIAPKVPIIFETAHALADFKEMAFEAGCDEFIAKPFDRKTIIELVNKYLGQ